MGKWKPTKLQLSSSSHLGHHHLYFCPFSLPWIYLILAKCNMRGPENMLHLVPFVIPKGQWSRQLLMTRRAYSQFADTLSSTTRLKKDKSPKCSLLKFRKFICGKTKFRQGEQNLPKSSTRTTSQSGWLAGTCRIWVSPIKTLSPFVHLVWWIHQMVYVWTNKL